MAPVQHTAFFPSLAGLGTTDVTDAPYVILGYTNAPDLALLLILNILHALMFGI